jgi:hypothetical protein
MAIVKVHYSMTAAQAKDTVRYIAFRSGREGKRTSRQLFDELGNLSKEQVYRIIDQEAQQGKRFYYHVVLSPDPTGEDTFKDLSLRSVAEDTICHLAKHTGYALSWAGTVHDDHTDKRHLHLLAIVPKRLDRQALTAARDGATRECQLQRRELDRARQRAIEQQEEEEMQWDYRFL